MSYCTGQSQQETCCKILVACAIMESGLFIYQSSQHIGKAESATTNEKERDSTRLSCLRGLYLVDMIFRSFWAVPAFYEDIHFLCGYISISQGLRSRSLTGDPRWHVLNTITDWVIELEHGLTFSTLHFCHRHQFVTPVYQHFDGPCFSPLEWTRGVCWFSVCDGSLDKRHPQQCLTFTYCLQRVIPKSMPRSICSFALSSTASFLQLIECNRSLANTSPTKLDSVVLIYGTHSWPQNDILLW